MPSIRVIRPALAVVLVAPLLAACNQTAAPPPAAPQVAAAPGVTPSSFRLPEGSGCAGAVSRFRAIIDNDLATGHVAARVHAGMVADLNEASAACAAGRDAEAQRMVAAIRSRNGYP